MKNILFGSNNNLRQNYLLAKDTSWKIGGPAEYFYKPTDIKELSVFLRGWKKRPITVLGAATNVLIRDGGIKGLVIYLHNCLNEINELDNFTLRVEAGVGLSRLLQKCTRLELIDAAFMVAIPGTVGGALAMNAGAYGDCIWNHVMLIETINSCGEIKLRHAKEFVASYRKVDGLAEEEWFIAAQLRFSRGDGDIQEIQKKIGNYFRKRKELQPLDLPSCGSVFRNPEGDYAARLIEASGLKGRSIGGAKISEKHANFIVNCGGASSVEVEALMHEIVVTVEKMHGVRLVPEVHIFG